MSCRFIVGLTGGIGSGKSAVCREFEVHGAPIVDADIVAREVVALGTQGLAEVTAEFGEEVLNEDGLINRSLLRKIVFESDAKRAKLESILHPKIRDLTQSKLNALSAPYGILCVPLLVEKKGYENLKRILVVDCSEETQIQRVMQRDELTRPQVEAIMRSQATRQQRLEHADDVIENSGDLDALVSPVKALHDKYLTIARTIGQNE